MQQIYLISVGLLVPGSALSGQINILQVASTKHLPLQTKNEPKNPGGLGLARGILKGGVPCTDLQNPLLHQQNQSKTKNKTPKKPSKQNIVNH